MIPEGQRLTLQKFERHILLYIIFIGPCHTLISKSRCICQIVGNYAPLLNIQINEQFEKQVCLCSVFC